jgi:signal transduction histidine kinase
MRFGSLIFAVVLLVATGAMAFVTVEHMRATRALVLHAYVVRGLLKDLKADVEENHANLDLYQLFRDRREAQELEAGIQKQRQAFDDLRLLAANNSTQQEYLQRFRLLLDKDNTQLHECLNEPNCLAGDRVDRTEQMAVISARRRTMSDMLDNMESMESQLLHFRLQTWDRQFTRVVISLIIAFILALVLLLYNFNLLIREIERRKHQEWVERKNAESYKMLSARILELQDVERRKIARELHDSVGQFLAAVRLNLGRLQRRDSELGHPNNATLTESLDLTDRAITEVRTISHLLHPPLLDELGFHSAARWYTEGFAKRSGVQVDLHLTQTADRLSKEVELALFRVLQESLTNVYRHAKASHVDIDVESTPEQVILSVTDNGNGINPTILEKFRAGEAGGIGLAGMRERLAELGGALQVESSSKGTQIRVTLPTGQCEPQQVSSPSENVTVLPG